MGRWRRRDGTGWDRAEAFPPVRANQGHEDERGLMKFVLLDRFSFARFSLSLGFCRRRGDGREFFSLLRSDEKNATKDANKYNGTRRHRERDRKREKRPIMHQEE